jgi:transcription-repair coupling factor (superfamily II helicase)
LADLHQLRGRVGRYKHRAYCYLLIDPHKSITPNAAKRLRAIEEFSDMGAGFAIAMRDLEIRGAGNILGTEQSGHIAAVGYELYCQLLEAAVRRLKQLPPRMVIDVDVDLPGEAYIPDDYVPDMRMKIDLYRRLTRVASDQELADYRGELADRFGSPPDAVRRMLDLTALKLEAAVWQINRVYQEDEYLVFAYTDRSRVSQLARNTGGKLRIVDEISAYLTLPQRVMEPDAIINAAKSVLRTI